MSNTPETNPVTRHVISENKRRPGRVQSVYKTQIGTHKNGDPFYSSQTKHESKHGNK